MMEEQLHQNVHRERIKARCHWRSLRRAVFLLLCICAVIPAQADWDKKFTESQTGGCRGFHFGHTRAGSTAITISPSHPYAEFSYAYLDRYGNWDRIDLGKFYWVLNDGSEELFMTTKEWPSEAIGDKTGVYVGDTYHDDNQYFRKITAYPTTSALKKGIKGIRLSCLWYTDDKHKEYTKINYTIKVGSTGISLSDESFDRPSPNRVSYTSKTSPCYSSSRNYPWIGSYLGNGDYSKNTYYTGSTGTITLEKSFANNKSYYLYRRVENSRSFIFDGVAFNQVFGVNNYGTMKLKACLSPIKLSHTFNLFDKSILLEWSKENTDGYTDGKWYIYRKTKSQTTYSLLTSDGVDISQTSYTDKSNLKFDETYQYKICFIRNVWITNDSKLKEKGVDDLTAFGNSYGITLSRNSAKPTIGKLQPKESSIGITATHVGYPVGTTMYVERSLDGNSWTKIEKSKKEIASATETDYSYVDTDINNSCILYHYRVATYAKELETTLYSQTLRGATTGKTTISSLNATKGSYSGLVKLTWATNQIGNDASKYVLQRRLVGDDNVYSTIYTTQGTGESYYFEDNTAAPGSYYEYRVSAYAKCDNSYTLSNELLDIGFAQSTGIVAGRISYGTGVAVNGVRINLSRNQGDSDGNNTTSQFSSMSVNGLGGGIHWKIAGDNYTDSTYVKELFLGKPFTFQMWIKPEANIKRSENSSQLSVPMFLDAYGAFSLKLVKKDDNSYLLSSHIADTTNRVNTFTSKVVIPANEWSNVFISTDGNGSWSIGKVNAQTVEKGTTPGTIISKWAFKSGNANISFGTNISNSNLYTFKGNIDEIRLWNRQLTDAEMQKNYDHLLVGTEKGLKLYYPLDEGINNAFDVSKSGGVPNEHHGLVAAGSTSSSMSPADSVSVVGGSRKAGEFGLYAITDSIGNYVLRGVPLSGEGINYSIMPTYGIHKFSPSSSSRFVSANSLTHNGVDFEDVSSFPVRGAVYYSGTDYPVKDVNFYVDGEICSKDGNVITTNEQGEYEISVPIGDHFITAEKNGHVFELGGRYPSDVNKVGLKKTFDRELSNLNFYDSTLVVIAGRVCGGDIEKEKPVGFGQSVNNIGKATIKLSTGYRMNVDRVIEGTTVRLDDGKKDVAVLSSTSAINSKAYRGSGNNENVKYINVTTDSLTGEFSIKVPPVLYKVESITVESNEDIKFGDVTNISVTNPLLVMKDSVENENGTEYYEYNAKNVYTYHSTPIFKVNQEGNPEGAFGIATYDYQDMAHTEKIDKIYSVGKDGAVSYAYGYPLFNQQESYTFNLKGYEEYVNKDAKEKPIAMQVPLANSVVTISNALSASQKVYVEDGNDEGSAVKAGEIKDLQDDQLSLDSLGCATYKWNAGLPNISSPYTRTLSMTYIVNNKTENWKIGENTFLEGIILGQLSTGSNFVTAGPDKVEMILRDPPGTGSSAWWESGTTITTKSTAGGAVISNNEVNTVSSLGYKTEVIKGTPGFGLITEMGSTVDLEVGLNVNVRYDGTKGWENTTTINKKISTSPEPEYVGAQGDVFIGNATNIIFGKARAVGFKCADDGSKTIDMQDVTTTGLSFGTAFNYSQNYIENVLLPNLELSRNSLLHHATSAEIASYKNTTSSSVYLTTLTKDDERFGSKNSDKEVWKEQAVKAGKLTGPSYRMFPAVNTNPLAVAQDSVLWYNNQIEIWKKTLAQNEAAKIKAIEARDKYLDKNYSFDSGSSIESSTSVDSTSTVDNEWSVETLAVIGASTGFEIAGTGVTASIKTETGGDAHGSTGSETTKTNTTGYSLVETGDDDALSVDVMKAPDGFGAIFRTRGGQTCCPYEGAVVSKYERPGFVLSDATMQIEKPSIEVETASVTNVPSGKAANYVLKLSNASEIDEDVYYNLSLIDETNSLGAIIKIDGQVLTSGRSIKVPAGQTITKSLQLLQTDLSVLKYEKIGLVLASQCQGDPTSTWDVIADSVFISAEFVPSSSDISLEIAKATMNQFTGNKLDVVIKDFDRQYKNFKAIRLQYKYAGDADWTIAKEYVLNRADKTENNEMIPSGDKIKMSLAMDNNVFYPDGNYVFRAITVSMYGNDEISRSSEEIKIVKDMARPMVLGSANPSDGILSAGDDISVKFNEDIRSGALTKANNFIITGALNDAQIDHSVALKLDGVKTASTESAIDLDGKDFAFDFWINHHGAGTILSHGTLQNNFKLSVNAQNQIVFSLGGKEFVSEKVLPQNKWAFFTLNFTKGETSAVVNASMAQDASTEKIFDNVTVPAYSGNGRIVVGENLTGAIHELTLWNTNRSAQTAQNEMYAAKPAYTPNLIGYWKMNEGHGLKAVDAARTRNMVLTNETWYLADENKAAQLKDNHFLSIDLSAASAGDNDSYAAELWFRGDKQTDATLMSVGAEKLALGFNANGKLSLTINGVDTELSKNNYLDGAWHHVALNVVRGGSAITYVDGSAVKVMAEMSVPALASDRLIVGAQRYTKTSNIDYDYRKYFTGDVDEIRIWNAALSGKFLNDNRYNRIDTASVAGLVAYYPMEKKGLDEGNQVVTNFSLENSSTNRTTAPLALGEGVEASISAPALKSAPTITNLQYSFTSSEREIYINLLDAASRLENTTVNLTLRNVRDNNNNLSEPIVWSAYVSQNGLTWSENEMQIEKDDESSKTFTVAITNKSGKTENWVINNLPTWLSASETQGSLEPQSSKTITFTVAASTAIGSYNETISLIGNNAINQFLTINMKVKGNEPEWNVDPSKYEWSMNTTAQLYINGKISENVDNKVAAFIDGKCMGVASPKLINTRDAYYVMMDVYGTTESAGKAVTFKVWDASTGIVYPNVSTSEVINFVSDGIVGSVNSPIILTTTDNIEQTINLSKGWNWTSFYVAPQNKEVAMVLKPIASTVTDVKSKTQFSQSNGETWTGSLTTIDGAKMYKMKAAEAISFDVSGVRIQSATTSQTIQPLWNWIGNTALANLSLDEAFASVNPETEDLVKFQSGFAIFNGYTWEGSLEVLKPGCGYLYYSRAKGNKQLTFPETSLARSTMSFVKAKTTKVSNFAPVADNMYPSNMTIVAKLMNKNLTVDTAEVAVFVGDECRGTARATADTGLYFITVAGNGSGDELSFKTWFNGELRTLDTHLAYADDASFGTLAAPYKLQLDLTGINHLSVNEVLVYPTITKGKLNIESGSTIDKITLFDLNGRSIETIDVANNQGTLNLSNRVDGNYVVSVLLSNGKTINKQIMKR